MGRAHELGELGGLGAGEEVRRARMPAWIWKCITGTCDTEGIWRPVFTLVF